MVYYPDMPKHSIVWEQEDQLDGPSTEWECEFSVDEGVVELEVMCQLLSPVAKANGAHAIALNKEEAVKHFGMDRVNTIEKLGQESLDEIETESYPESYDYLNENPDDESETDEP